MSPTEETTRTGSPTPDAAVKWRGLSGASHTWRALRHRNFRLFFGGQSISLIGTWMTRIATAWLVYRLTGSALLLGTVSFAGQIPTFLIAPFAGVWVDRLDRRQVLVWTQTLAMVQSLALAALTLSGHITIPLILILSVTQGIINGFDMPGRQSFMVQMVEDRADLGNAIAINSSMVNVARLIGPSLAGMLIAVSSEGWCFLVDGISYIAVIASLLAMRLPAAPAKRPAASMCTELHEGWTYVSGFLPVRTILMLFAVVSLMGMPFVVLMPIFAARVLHGGPHTLGFLMGAMGVGALGSALSLAARKNVRGLIRRIPVAAAIFGVGLIGFGLSHWFWLSMAMAAGGGRGHDAGHGRQQHHHPNAGERRQARARDELLHHGVHGHGALWQPAGRLHGQRLRRAVDGDCERSGGSARRGAGSLRAAGDQRGDSPDLSGDGHSAGGRRSAVMSEAELKLDPKRTAIVVIDLQKGIVALHGSPLATATVVGNAARLLTAARTAERSLCWFMWADRRMAPIACIGDRRACAHDDAATGLDGIDPGTRPAAGRCCDFQAPVGRVLRHRPRPATAPAWIDVDYSCAASLRKLAWKARRAMRMSAATSLSSPLTR